MAGILNGTCNYILSRMSVTDEDMAPVLADAQRLGYLRSVDAVTMNRERLIADAKARALQRVAEGYQPPAPRMAIPVGGDAVLAPLKLGIHLAWRAGRISDHDALIGRKLATIMAGGSLPHPSTVSEQELLDLRVAIVVRRCAVRRSAVAAERFGHFRGPLYNPTGTSTRCPSSNAFPTSAKGAAPMSSTPWPGRFSAPLTPWVPGVEQREPPAIHA